MRAAVRAQVRRARQPPTRASPQTRSLTRASRSPPFLRKGGAWGTSEGVRREATPRPETQHGTRTAAGSPRVPPRPQRRQQHTQPPRPGTRGVRPRTSQLATLPRQRRRGRTLSRNRRRRGHSVTAARRKCPGRTPQEQRQSRPSRLPAHAQQTCPASPFSHGTLRGLFPQRTPTRGGDSCVQRTTLRAAKKGGTVGRALECVYVWEGGGWGGGERDRKHATRA